MVALTTKYSLFRWHLLANGLATLAIGSFLFEVLVFAWLPSIYLAIGRRRDGWISKIPTITTGNPVANRQNEEVTAVCYVICGNWIKQVSSLIFTTIPAERVVSMSSDTETQLLIDQDDVASEAGATDQTGSICTEFYIYYYWWHGFAFISYFISLR